MAFPVPAICENPFCRLVYFQNGIINISHPDSRITIDGPRVGPCPRCGGLAKIVPGTYRLFKDGEKLIPGVELKILEKALIFLQAQQSSGKAPEMIKQEAIAEIPELNSLWDLIPKKRSEAYAVFAILITVILGIINLCRSGQPSKGICLPDEIISALQKNQSASPQDTHTPRKKHKRPKK